MSTYTTVQDVEFHALRDDPDDVELPLEDASAAGPPERDDWRIVRVSRCLATGSVAVDVETPLRYDRIPLTPQDAAALGRTLIDQATAAQRSTP